MWRIEAVGDPDGEIVMGDANKHRELLTRRAKNSFLRKRFRKNLAEDLGEQAIEPSKESIEKGMKGTLKTRGEKSCV